MKILINSQPHHMARDVESMFCAESLIKPHTLITLVIPEHFDVLKISYA